MSKQHDNLRERIIRLAWSNPGPLRDVLLPLVRVARSAPAFERKQVEIKTRNGSTTIPAVVSGVWAVHKSVAGSGWSVTHIPSGLAASTRIGTKKEGMAVIQAFAEVEPALMTATDDGTVRRFGATIIDILRDPYQYLDVPAPKTRRAPAVVLDFEAILKDEGLRNLGTRYGKRGDNWGLEGRSEMLRVGGRDIVLSGFSASMDSYSGKVKGSWGMLNAEAQNKITEPQLRQWAKRVKRSPTMQSLRDEVRSEA